MTETKRPLKVFLCHAHADRDAVRALYARLKREGVDVWLDKEKLLPGADWEYEIRKAVREADVVVVCLSKQFNQAGFRQKEVRIALNEADMKPEGEIFIIPARLEESDNLESLSKWHWVDLFESNGFQLLMRALRIRAEKIGAELRQRKNAGATAPRPKIKQEQADIDKASRLKAEQDAAEQARLDAEELERQKAAKAQADREAKDAVEKARLDGEELNQQKANTKAGYLPSIRPKPNFLGISITIIIILGVLGMFNIIKILSNATPKSTITPNATVTNTVTITQSLTFTPNLLLTKLTAPTYTKTKTPTPTPTLIPIPTSSILLQEDFEDNKFGEWFSWQSGRTKAIAPSWTIEQDPDGNYYASASGIADPSDIWYVNNKTSSWADYAIETRVRFVRGTKLKILTYANGGSANNVVALNDTGVINFAQWNSAIAYKDLGSATLMPIDHNKWYTIKVEMLENLMRVYINNSLIKTLELPLPLINKSGGVGFDVTGEEIDIDDIMVWSLR